MDYLLEIPALPELGAFDFIVTWNQLPETSAMARARLTAGTPQVFDFQSVSGTLLVLGGAPADLPPEMLHRLVRRVLVQRGITRPTFAEQRIQPDGSSLLVVAFAEA